MINSTLEMHYYFPDESHSMNAVVRNKCEAELLELFIEAATTLGIKVELESQAYEEGGLKELWKALGDSNNQINTLLVIIMLVLTRVPVTDPVKEALDAKLTTLQIEEKKLQINKLQRELGQPAPRPETTEEAVNALNKNPKIVVRRSNFYKQLDSYPKVKSIGVTPFKGNKL